MVGGDGVFTSVDGGDTWLPLTQGLGETSVTSLVRNPANPGTLFAGTINEPYRSLTMGIGWEEVMGIPAFGVSAITAGTSEADRVYAAAQVTFPFSRPSVYVSFDNGISWTSVSNGSNAVSRIESLTASPLDPSLLYAATSQGVYVQRLVVIFADGFESGGSAAWAP